MKKEAISKMLVQNGIPADLRKFEDICKEGGEGGREISVTIRTRTEKYRFSANRVIVHGFLGDSLLLRTCVGDEVRKTLMVVLDDIDGLIVETE